MPLDVDGLIVFAQALVREPSVFDPARGLDEAGAAELVGEQMRSFGWTPHFELVEPGRPNVLCTVDGGLPGPTLLFEGHTDVVTEGNPDQWSFDPFGAEIRDGRLLGRGSADMKAGVAAMLYATREIESRGPFPGRILLAALVDEEGMMAGAKHFVAAGHAAGLAGAIHCEPEGGEVCHVAKGALRIRIDLHGRMAHGAMPFQGRNPNRAVGELLVALARLEERLQRTYDEHEHLGRVWVTPTVLRAGEPVQMNVMPADASLWIDIRTIPGVDHGRLVADLGELAHEVGAPLDVGTTVSVIDDRPAVATSATHDLVRAVRGAHERVTGEPSRLGGVPGATDGTVITSRAGVPSVVYGPGGKWIAHQADEFVEVADLVRHAEVYADAALTFLGGSFPSDAAGDRGGAA